MGKLLIVVDMQNDFINGALGTKEAMEILPKVIEKIKNYKGEIIFTRDTHGKEYLKTQEGKNLPVKHCIEGTYGWQLQEEIQRLAEKKESRIINKPSFGSLELPNIIKDFKVSNIEIVGLCTDICVISNAMILKAAMPEVNISVDSSCCAGVTPESHDNALRAMKMCQIEIY